MVMKKLASHEEWLAERKFRIGGSEAACLIGRNPWKTNVDLFREKTGRAEPPDLSENEAVRYGTEAERHLRDLFALNHPRFKVGYEENNLFLNPEVLFAHASLDGWLTEPVTGLRGVLEIKTSTINAKGQLAVWKRRVPDHYYCQVQWYLMVTGYTFGWLYALLREPFTGTSDEGSEIRGYYIPRDEEAIKMLRDAGERFYRALEADEEPALILPEI